MQSQSTIFQNGRRLYQRFCERCGASFFTSDIHRINKGRFCSRVCARTSPLTVKERFWARVDKNGPIPEFAPHLGHCWLWTAGKAKFGYGRLGGNAQLAHRMAYEWEHGPIPEGLEPDHLCRVPACVRPFHLEPVTKRDNILRGFGASAIHARQTECIHGHLFTPENTRIRKNGGRRCRTCDRSMEQSRAPRHH